MKWIDNLRARSLEKKEIMIRTAIRQKLYGTEDDECSEEDERIEMTFQETMEKVMALLNLMKGFKLNEYDIIRKFFRNSDPFAEYHDGRQTLLVKKSDLKQLNILWKKYRN